MVQQRRRTTFHSPKRRRLTISAPRFLLPPESGIHVVLLLVKKQAEIRFSNAKPLGVAALCPEPSSDRLVRRRLTDEIDIPCGNGLAFPRKTSSNL